MGDGIEQLTEEILVDAFGIDEQLWSFRQAFEDRVRFPITGRVVGAPVDIVEIDYDGDELRGLVAICQRDGEQYAVSLLDFVPGPVSVETARLLDAYRRWSGVEPAGIPEQGAPRRAWVYERLAPRSPGVGRPLKLYAMGTWQAEDEYWGEPGDPIDPLLEPMIAAGSRDLFEMEQVIPGAEIDDFDDPIVRSAELHHAGYNREAEHLLEELLEQDSRCIDAHVHLGVIALNSRGPKTALPSYQAGVSIGEESLPDGFGGVLSWGLIDNRPFLRALEGLGLCAWRQRRWHDAEAAFTTKIWLDPCHSIGEVACLHEVLDRRRWRRLG